MGLLVGTAIFIEMAVFSALFSIEKAAISIEELHISYRCIDERLDDITENVIAVQSGRKKPLF